MTLVALVAAALPASALATGSSPVLSGYAGPGSGEQAVLGGGVVGGSGGGSGDNNNNSGNSASLAATTRSGSAPSSGRTATPDRSSTGTGAPLASTPHRKKSSSTSSPSPSGTSSTTSTGSSKSSSSQASSATAPPARPGAPAVVAYRNTGGEVSSFPLTAGGVLIVLLGLLAVVLAAIGLRMIMRDGSDDGPPISQVAVR